ncbi:11682_t:CDS:1, partial [Funneliformis geosporum]
YLDFEKEELSLFTIQCKKELQTENSSSDLPNLKDYNQSLAT